MRSNSFQKARYQLTAWYLLIIMFVSISFSVVFFQAASFGIDRIVASRYLLATGGSTDRFILPLEIRNGLDLFKAQLQFVLVIVNGAILIFAGVAGYFLAGRTLKPIKDMLDEQSRFIADASHELKTPIAALRSEYEVALLEGDKIPHKTAIHLVKSGLEEIVRLQHLAENLIELTRQQGNARHLSFDSVSLLDIIEASLKNIVPQARQKHIVIQNEVEDCEFKGARSSLIKLFTILLDNAIKYSPSNSQVKVVSRQSSSQIEVSVSDQGIGISKKDLPHIFDRFYRADKSRSQTPGFGLGLSIAQQVVSSHHGNILVSSQPGKGTVFSIQLPLRLAAKF